MRGIKWDLPQSLYSPDDPEFKEWSRGFEKITEEQRKLLTGDKKLIINPSTPARGFNYFYNKWIENASTEKAEGTFYANSSGKDKD